MTEAFKGRFRSILCWLKSSNLFSQSSRLFVIFLAEETSVCAIEMPRFFGASVISDSFTSSIWILYSPLSFILDGIGFTPYILAKKTSIAKRNSSASERFPHFAAFSASSKLTCLPEHMAVHSIKVSSSEPLSIRFFSSSRLSIMTFPDFSSATDLSFNHTPAKICPFIITRRGCRPIASRQAAYSRVISIHVPRRCSRMVSGVRILCPGIKKLAGGSA